MIREQNENINKEKILKKKRRRNIGAKYNWVEKFTQQRSSATDFINPKKELTNSNTDHLYYLSKKQKVKRMKRNEKA